MKVIVDLEKCKGEGRCFEMYSDVFEKGIDGKSKILNDEIDSKDVDRQVQAGSAEMMCPNSAIIIVDN